MTTRRAACTCGQLSATCEGEPVRRSMCHCSSCQRRTGSVFGVQARFPRERVHVEGRATEFSRVADSGNRITFHFCPTCGTTLYWMSESDPSLLAVAVGAFADPSFPAPHVSVYEARRHGWARAPDDAEHLD